MIQWPWHGLEQDDRFKISTVEKDVDFEYSGTSEFSIFQVSLGAAMFQAPPHIYTCFYLCRAAPVLTRWHRCSSSILYTSSVECYGPRILITSVITISTPTMEYRYTHVKCITSPPQTVVWSNVNGWKQPTSVTTELETTR